MDRDIMASEVRAALNRIKTTAAAGDDHITNKMLRNLDDQSVAALTDLFNHHWHEGRLPDSWKHAKIQHDILDPGPIRATPTILGLDISKAFDNVSQASILTNLSQMSVGTRTYNYIANFLHNRTSELHIGDLCSDKVTMGTRGTPQGAVLSPFLFNITMRGLPTLLDTLPHIKHSIYIDDITLWTNSGSDGEIQDSLQQAIDTVHTYVQANGLVCSPNKSELLVIRDRRVRRPVPDPQEPIMLHIATHPIAPVQTIRVLSMLVQNNTLNSEAVQRLRTTAHQINGLIRRIATRRRGMRETDLCRLTQAYLISRIVYTYPYYHLRRKDEEAVNSIIRSAKKAAMGLPQSASTQRLLQLGVYNTLTELIEAHKTAQIHRLSRTEHGRYILNRLNIKPTGDIHPTTPLLTGVFSRLGIKPMAKNMLPGRHDRRRQLKAQALDVTYSADEHVMYVDAAKCDSNTYVACVATPTTTLISAAKSRCLPELEQQKMQRLLDEELATAPRVRSEVPALRQRPPYVGSQM
ncbi:uncharacterized protein LOC142574930 [Dermacentor variabilis]|uniref:uncharacterized protein LOC142574930 n=1 Tax=Dermacentor variabilis TaxID=34621 RepID=UPI003F5B21E3